MRTPRHRLLGWSASGLVLICVAALVPAAAGATGATSARSVGAATSAASHKTVHDRVRVYDQNMEGAVAHGQLPKIEATLKSFHPDVVTLEEICRNQVATLRHKFPGYHTHFTKMRVEGSVSASGHRTGCRQSGASSDLGELVASPHRMEFAHRYYLGTYLRHDPDKKPTRHFHLTCADIAMPHAKADAVRACVTHLRSGHRPKEGPSRNKERRKEDNKIASITHPWVKAGQRVILDGDFNARPTDPTLNAIYNLSLSGHFTGRGDFVESDQTDSRYFGVDPSCDRSTGHCRSGEPTIALTKSPKRYDYIFFSRGPVKYHLSGKRVSNFGSDHHAVEGFARLPLPAA